MSQSDKIAIRWRRSECCQACQKVRGIAAVVKGSRERDGLLRIRAAWGDFDEPPAVRVGAGVAMLDAADAF